MNQAKIEKIIWDLDNTLWDWINYAVNTYPAMSKVIAEVTGVARDRVEQCMKNYYTESETMESSWLAQSLIEQGLLDDSRLDELVAALQAIFHETRNDTLRVYEGVEKILEIANSRGIENIVLTDAPAFHAASRLRHLKLDQSHINKMFALEDGQIDRIPKKYYEKFDKGGYGLDFPVVRLAEEKPHTDLEEILQLSRDQIQEQVIIIGDNMKKDMGLANRYSCLGLHAQWGQASTTNLQILGRFAPARVAEKNLGLGAQESAESNIIGVATPAKILNLLQWD